MLVASDENTEGKAKKAKSRFSDFTSSSPNVP